MADVIKVWGALSLKGRKRNSQRVNTGAVVASLLAIDGQIHVRLLAALCVRGLHLMSPRKQRAQGKPGARCTRSRAWWVESTRVSHHRFTGTPGLPCAMVLTGSFALPPVIGLVCHRRPQEAYFPGT